MADAIIGPRIAGGWITQSVSVSDLSIKTKLRNRTLGHKLITLFRASLVLMLLIFTGCETVGNGSSPKRKSAIQSNDDDVRFVLNELQNRPKIIGSGVALFLTELTQELELHATSATDKGNEQKRDADALTVQNPTYWQAVLEMGKDRVLLFWLRGLLLAQEKKIGQAFEWNLFVRQSVFLSADFDEKWLTWERRWIEHLNQEIAEEYDLERVHSSLVQRRWVRAPTSPDSSRLALSVTSTPLIQISDSPFFGMGFLPLYDLGYESRFWQQFQNEALHPRIRDAISKTWVHWPYESLLAPDELVLAANWYGRHQAYDFALVSYMGARDRGNLIQDAVTKVLLESQLGKDRANEVIERASKFSDTFSQRFVGDGAALATIRPINPFLQKQLTQTLRRLEGIDANITQWSIDRAQFYASLALHHEYLGQPAQMRIAVNQLVNHASNSLLAKELQLQLAMLEGDRTAIKTALESLQQGDSTMKETALKQAQGAFALGDWLGAAKVLEAASRAFQNQSQYERKHYALLHQYVCTKLSGNAGDLILKSPFPPLDDSDWTNQLRRTLLGDLDRDSLLELAQIDSDFETAGRLCEAHLILAFTPDQTAAGRKSSLQACLNTGRVDSIGYQMAWHLLRELRATE